MNQSEQLDGRPGQTKAVAPCIYRTVPDAAASVQDAQAACQGGHSFACAILDVLPQQIAVLRADATIAAVNASWRHFAKANARADAGPPASIDDNYVTVCLTAHGFSSEQVHAAADGIAAVLAGRHIPPQPPMSNLGIIEHPGRS